MFGWFKWWLDKPDPAATADLIALRQALQIIAHAQKEVLLFNDAEAQTILTDAYWHIQRQYVGAIEYGREGVSSHRLCEAFAV